MKLLMMACSEKAIRDIETSNISLIDITDVLFGDFPLFVEKLSVTAIFLKEDQDEDSESVFFIMKNNEDTMVEREVVINFAGRPGNRSFNEISGLVVPEPGTFSIAIRHGDRILHDWRIPAISDDSEDEGILEE